MVDGVRHGGKKTLDLNLTKGLGLTSPCWVPHCRIYNLIFFFSLKRSALRGHRSFQLPSQTAWFMFFSDIISGHLSLILSLCEPELTQADFPPLLCFVFSRHFTLNSGNLIPSPLQGVFVFFKSQEVISKPVCGYVCVLMIRR